MTLEGALLWRNARLRAWRALGVPAEGGWHMRGPDERHDRRAALRIGCSRCGKDEGCVAYYEWELARSEVTLVAYLVEECRCPHLSPLLGPEPPDLEAIAALELLALE